MLIESGTSFFFYTIMEDLRKRYIDMRNKKVIDIKFFYDYAIHKGFSYSIDDFYHVFLQSNINEILKQIDIEFNLSALYDCEDNFIRIVEDSI